MVAKKSKGWRSGKREVRPRMVQMTRHLVVTEGKETEPRYFEGVRAALCAADERKVAVIVKGTGKHTLDLLDFAVEHCRYAPETFDHVCSCLTRMTFLRPTSTRWSVNALSSPMARGPSTRCGRIPALNCGLFCTFVIRLPPCRPRSVSAPLLRRCLRTWASSTARTWAGCSKQWTINGGEALQRAGRLDTHHRELGNLKPSLQNPATKVGEIFDVIGPYLVG